MTGTISLDGLTHDDIAVVEELAKTDPALAAAYADQARPNWAVVVAGYPYTNELAQSRPPACPHWSGVVFWPWAKAEVIRLAGDTDEHGRRPHKWPVLIETFGLDYRAAQRRSIQVHFAMAQAVLDDTPGCERTGIVPLVMRRCAWCGVEANEASMERINNGGSVGCRNTRECAQRTEQTNHPGTRCADHSMTGPDHDGCVR